MDYLWNMNSPKDIMVIESSRTLKYHQFAKISFQKSAICDQETIVVFSYH
jgi:hypothetical protein